MSVSGSGELNCVVTLAMWNADGGTHLGLPLFCVPNLNVLAGGSC